MRRWAMILAVTLALAGCQGAPRHAAAPAAPEGAQSVGEPQPGGGRGAPVAAAPGDAASPGVPCRGTITAGPPAMTLRVAGLWVTLPFSDCRLAAGAGAMSLYLLAVGEQVGKPITVTGAAAGRWEGESYRVDVAVQPGETHPVAFDLSALGLAPIRYTLVGGGPLADFLAAGPSRQGPWTAVPAGGVIPPEQGWLRVSYPLPMQAGGPAPLATEQYGQTGTLTGEWEGDRTQYVAIADQPPILYVAKTADANGLQMWQQAGPVFRGAPPELQRLDPAGGSARTVYRFAAEPGGLAYEGGAVRFAQPTGGAPAYQRIDLASGAVSPAEAPVPPAGAGSFRFASPDGKLVAELQFGGGPPGPARDRGDAVKRTAALVIRGQATGRVVLGQADWVSSWGYYGCSNQGPGFGWRADGGAVAALDAPDQDRLVLKVADLKGNTRGVAAVQGQGAAFGQFADRVAWAPSGRLIYWGTQVVEADSGRVVAQDLFRQGFWSPDSRYLLLYQPDHPFTNWGKVALLEVAGGRSQSLGHGQAVGWTPQGEALFVRWDLSRLIPGPGKDC